MRWQVGRGDSEPPRQQGRVNKYDCRLELSRQSRHRLDSEDLGPDEVN
jgi:hypothetical protein